ncbi:MAG: hypothetical protein K6T75_08995 [Acetobacteraceae bacterium]|nr:hypothetical protein [Acetobacteraceae bacterium]
MARRKSPWLLGLVALSLAAFLLAGCAGQPPAPKQLPPERKVPAIDLWITTQDYDPVRYEAGLMIAENWKKLGFEVTTTPMEWATMSTKGMNEHQHQAFMCQWGGRPERIDPFQFIYALHHSSQAEKGGYNIAGYINPEFDSLADRFVKTMDLQTRRDLAFKLQEMLAVDCPQPPIAMRVVTHAYNSRDFENPTMFMGEGLNAFWNWMTIAPKGERKVVRFGYVSDVKLLNPLSTKTGADIQILRLIYDPLVRVDVNGEPQPWAAESYTSLDPTTIEVKLRPDLYFHDGRKVTAQDVKFTYDLAMQTKAPYYSANIKQLKEVQVVDESTLRFVLSEPFAPFVSNALGMVGIMPRHIWEPLFKGKGAEAVLTTPNLPPIGSGPFKFAYWRPEEELKLVRFDRHFSPPKIEGILRIPYAKAYGVVEGLKADEVDVGGWSLLPLQVEELKKAPHLTVLTVDDLGYYMMHYNLRVKPFDNPAVRRALTYAIPKKQIVEVVFEGQAVPAYSVVAPVNKFWFNPNTEKPGDDLEKARQILVQSGFEWDESGRLYYPPGTR